MLKALYKFIFFTCAGWSIEGQLPKEKKYVLIVAPHTSNWDFLIGVFSRRILNFNPQFVGKKELFVWPLGYFFKWMGGYPVDRKSSSNFVQQMTELFQKEDEFILTMTPEGTRKLNNDWKTGYYYVAKSADVPILPVGFDFGKKRVVLGPCEKVKESVEESVMKYKKYFSQFEGKNPKDGVQWKD
ncbi:acyltransferase [bacterium]|nr:acyltransferase [bacterium]